MPMSDAQDDASTDDASASSQRPSMRRGKPLAEGRLDELAARAAELPEPLAALAIGIEVARADNDATGVRKRLFELGIGVVRYALSVALALLREDLGEKTAPKPVADALLRAARLSDGQWCDLARTLGSLLRTRDEALGAPFAFTTRPALTQLVASRNDFIHRGGLGDDALERAEAVLNDAEALLALEVAHVVSLDPPAFERRMGSPIRPGIWRKTNRKLDAAERAPGVYVGDPRGGFVRVSPLLPLVDKRLVLIDGPHAPGKSWRFLDPETGEHREAAELDRAVRALVGSDPNAPRELCAEPGLVGRGAAIKVLARAAEEAISGAIRVVLLTGPFGMGRSRLLSALVDASAGFGVARTLVVTCSAERRGPLRGLAHALRNAPGFERVREAVNQAISQMDGGGRAARDALVEGVEETLLEESLLAPIGLIFDDVQHGDEETWLLLRLLTERATKKAEGRLLLVAACRDEPNAAPSLARWIGQVEADVGSGATRVALENLNESEVRALAQRVGPLAPSVEDAVAQGAGGVPFYVVQPLLVWSESGQLTWRDAKWHAVDDEVLRRAAPGMADLVRARVSSYFEGGSEAERGAEQILASLALRGGTLLTDDLLAVLGKVGAKIDVAEHALAALAEAGLIATRAGGSEVGFAQGIVERAVVDDLAKRPWFRRLFRTLLEHVAGGAAAEDDAAFLARGYLAMQAVESARPWFERGTARALARGSFEEAERLAAQWEKAESEGAPKIRAALRGIEAALGEGRAKEAATRLAALRAGAALAGDLDVEARILALAVGAITRDLPWDAEPSLVVDADATGREALSFEARLAVARHRRGADGIAAIDEALTRGELTNADRYRALALRFELVVQFVATDKDERRKAAQSLCDAARALGSSWAELDAQNSAAVAESDAGNHEAAVTRFDALALKAKALRLGTLEREARLNAATTCLRQGRPEQTLTRARGVVEAARAAGDGRLLSQAQSIRADAALRVGELGEAKAAIDEAVGIALAARDYTATLALLRRAEIQAKGGEWQAARGDATLAREWAENARNVDHLVRAEAFRAMAAARLGDPGAAADIARVLALAMTEKDKLRAPTQRLLDELSALTV